MIPPHHADGSATAPCRCGHSRDLHEHDRPGSDCGVGGPAHCRSFRHATPLPARLIGRLVRRPAPAHTTDRLAPVLHLAAGTRRSRAAASTLSAGHATGRPPARQSVR